MENTLEQIAKCRYKTKMDKRNGFWQVDLTAAAEEHHVVHTSCAFSVCTYLTMEQKDGCVLLRVATIAVHGFSNCA